MNSKILKLSIIILLTGLKFTGCQYNFINDAEKSKNTSNITFPNDTILVSNRPGVSVYKTKNDYFNYISVQLLPDGRINAIPDYTLNNPRIKIDKNGKIEINTRWLLPNGYIVDIEASLNESFSDITFQEYVDYNTANGVAGWSAELIRPRIIDTDPFTEFYYMGCSDCKIKYFTLAQIYQMLENGTIEEYFKKLK